jgi:dTDP-4-dehydrorhamnose 3,5-epimerase
MNFIETDLPGAFIIEIERLVDERGFFARTWCSDEFKENGLPSQMKQASTSFNRQKGTLRGMHFSTAPCKEAKLVRCTAGSIADVIIDIRPDSPTFLKHTTVELSAESRNALFVPPGFAHGYQTLEDDTEIYYMMTEEYRSGHADGFRWNDPVFGISWPEADRIIFQRDEEYPDFTLEKVQMFSGYYSRRL